MIFHQVGYGLILMCQCFFASLFINITCYSFKHELSHKIRTDRIRTINGDTILSDKFNPELISWFQLDVDNEKLAQFALDIEKKEDTIQSGNNLGGNHSSFMLFDNYPSDISQGKDYLGEEKVNVDYTISNPPFVPRKLFWGFMVRAILLSLCVI